MSSLETTLPATRRRARQSTTALSPKNASDKENATVNLGSAITASRKSRSKSIGPGGLDALKTGTGNRRVSLAAPSRPPPRSILKTSSLFLPEIPPHKPKDATSTVQNVHERSQTSSAGVEKGTKIALRTEKQQQAAAREREEKERRETRRKSLANRRVSFAAEATLHTFHEHQDTTTSTDSSGRRASRVASPWPASSANGSHTGPGVLEPPEAGGENHVTDMMPTNPGETHQRKRRRSSGGLEHSMSPLQESLACTVYSSDSDHADGVAEIDTTVMEENSSDDNNSCDDEDGTVVTFDADEITGHSVASTATARSHPGEQTDTSGSIDEILRLAARMASTQRFGNDDEVIDGFAGWGQRSGPKAATALHHEPVHCEDDGAEVGTDMDMTNAMIGFLRRRHTPPYPVQEQDGSDMFLDVTQAKGTIIARAQPRTHHGPESATRQWRDDDQTSVDDEPMELTAVMGGIRHGSGRRSDSSVANTEVNEDMSMELTAAVGGMLGVSGQPNLQSSGDDMDGDGASLMDMTVPVGQILAGQQTEQDGDDEDSAVAMDMTMAIGGTLWPAAPNTPLAAPTRTTARSAANEMMEQEADETDSLMARPMWFETQQGEAGLPASKSGSAIGLDSGASGLAAFQGTGRRRSLSPQHAAASRPANRGSANQSLGAHTCSPRRWTRNLSPPSPAKATTPPDTIQSRSSSPVRHVSPTTARPGAESTGLRCARSVFKQDPSTGTSTPSVLLTPQRRQAMQQQRRLSGVGADRSGLGSPKVARIFDERRGSLGEVASDFVPGSGKRIKLGYAEPREMEAEMDGERHADEDGQSLRRIAQPETDGGDATLNLKDMIQAMSPKKGALRGRKSLHVGSAKGLLGKRPAELDHEENEDSCEDNAMDRVKRLQGLPASPVKKVHLRGPPSKQETMTGRKTRAAHFEDENRTTATPLMRSSSPLRTATTPKAQERSKNAAADGSTATRHRTGADHGDTRIHLQDFLNMTSIRFMELNTTKRRFTVVQPMPMQEAGADRGGDMDLERCVVAGACIVPMLEMYQHSCRELKRYISEGRRVVREIETETFEDNPLLFREYVSASPEFRALMDNQFKNVKTHARLLSKADWYDWRMKLQNGLKEGLVQMEEGMEGDENVVKKQETVLTGVLPGLATILDALETECEDLRAVARESDECGADELRRARLELVSADAETAQKLDRIAQLQKQLVEAEAEVKRLTSQKTYCLGQICESEQVREECRGWTAEEIAALKGTVEELEKQHGWAITGVQGSAVVLLTYQGEIELVLDMAAFGPRGRDASRIADVWYVGHRRAKEPLGPAGAVEEFWLQGIRECVRWMQTRAGHPSAVLRSVQLGWDTARLASERIRVLGASGFPTHLRQVSDATLQVVSSVLLRELRTRVELVLELRHQPPQAAGDAAGRLDVLVAPSARVVYGKVFDAQKMADFLAARLGGLLLGPQVGAHDGTATRKDMHRPQQGVASWCEAVAELRERLTAQGIMTGRRPGTPAL